MKKINFVATFIVGAVLFSSCSYQIFPKNTLEFNYDVNMNSENDLKAKANVNIYFSESEVPSEYEVIAFVRYTPLSLPIIASEQSQQLKKFYKKAVLKAQDLGGNGVIINTIGDFRIIDIPALKEVEAVEAPRFSPILNSAVLSIFEDGSILNAENKQKVKYITMLEDEIKSNLKVCKTTEEANYIKKKIDALRAYYDRVGKISKKMKKTIEGYDVSLKAVEKKIAVKASKAGQKVDKATRKASKAVKNTTNKVKDSFEK